MTDTPIPPPSGVAQTTPTALHVYRIIVWLVVATAALVIVSRPFDALPPPSEPAPLAAVPDFMDALETAESENDLNARRTESAPQQQVVNGWYSNDLLEIIAHENAWAIVAMRDTTLAQQAATANAYAMAAWEIRDRREESLVVIFGLGAAAHLAGSSLILLIAGRRGRPRRDAASADDAPVTSEEPQPTAEPFDPRPHG